MVKKTGRTSKAGKKKAPVSTDEKAPASPREPLMGEDGEVTRRFKQVLVELFGRFDVDGDKVLNEAELRAFSIEANGSEDAAFSTEELDEIKEFFDWKTDGPNGGGLTLRGWLNMYHTQTAAREEDTWADLRRLGYSGSLVGRPGRANAWRTRSVSLQARLEEIVQLGEAGDLEAMVAAMVAPDVEPEDREAFLSGLRGSEDEPAQLPDLLAELRACAAGVNSIQGNEKEGPVTFHFPSPKAGAENIDREVAFVKVDGQWFAEG